MEDNCDTIPYGLYKNTSIIEIRPTLAIIEGNNLSYIYLATYAKYNPHNTDTIIRLVVGFF
jgi:hypothetical protein